MRGMLLFLLVVALAAALVAGTFSLFSPSPTDLSDTSRPAPPADPEPARPEPPPPVAGAGATAGVRATGETGVVAGRVLDPDGKPAAGAAVTLAAPASEHPGPRSVAYSSGGMRISGTFDVAVAEELRVVARATAGEDGQFALETAETGPFVLTASAAGAADARSEGIERGRRDVVLRLGAAGAVTGRVVDDAGAPVEAAIVTAGTTTAFSAADGSFRLDGVPVGEDRRVAAAATGYEGADTTVDVVRDGTAALAAPLVITGKPGITGRVFGADGAPLEGATVLAGQGDNLMSMRAAPGQSDAAGRFHVEDEASGDLTLTYLHAEHLRKKIEIRHDKGRRTVAPDVRLDPGGVIAGRILDEDGKPVAGAEPNATNPSAGMDLGFVFTMASAGGGRRSSDSNGEYRVPGLESGSYTLKITAPGYEPFLREEVAVTAPKTTRIDVVLARGNRIAGVVLDPDGKPVEGADVSVEVPFEPTSIQEAMTGGRPPIQVKTGPDGRFEATGVGNAPADVTASHGAFPDVLEEGVDPGRTDVMLKFVRPGSFSGRVVAKETGEPVAGVSLTLGETAVQSSEEGTFTFEKVSPGTWDFQATSDEHVPYTETGLVIAEGQEIRDHVVELERGEALVVLVVRAADGRPVPGARIDLGGPVDRSGVGVDEAGRATLRGLLPGAYELTASHDDYASGRRNATVPVSGEVRVELTPGGSIRGVVLDREGRPVSGRMISVGEGGDFGRDMEVTDEEGRFTFEHVTPGERSLMLVDMDGSGGGMGFDMKTKRVTVEEGKETYVEFGGPEDRKTTRVHGRLLDRGKPVAGRMLVLLPVDSPEAGFKMSMTDAEGAYDLADLAPGRYAVLVAGGSGDGFGAASTIDVTEGGEIRRDVELPAGRLSGRVVRADTGAGVPGARVMLVDGRGLERAARNLAELVPLMKGQARTGEDGKFEIANAEPGEHVLVVTSDDLALVIREDVRVTEAAASPLRIEAGAGSRLKVRVEGPGGTPVSGVVLSLFTAGGRWVPLGDDLAVEADPAGRTELRLGDGEWRVRAQADGFASAAVAVSLSGDREVVLRLAPGGSVNLAAAGAAGPVAGADVRIYREDGSEVWKVPTQDTLMTGAGAPRTGADGRARLTDLPAGRLRIVVTATDGRGGETTVRVPEGGAADATVAVN